MQRRSFKNFGIIDVAGFKKIISENNFDWDEFNFRQQRGQMVHKETKSIPIIFDESFSLQKFTKTKYYHLFENEINKLETHLLNTIQEDGYIFRALLVNLPAHKEIKPHIDTGASLVIPRRIHIPITTNQDCYFTVGDTKKNLKEGEIWEIDNDGRRHSVSNGGDTDRIHLIVDFLKK